MGFRITLVFLSVWFFSISPGPVAAQTPVAADTDAGYSDSLEDDFLDDFEESTPQIEVADPLYYLNYGVYLFNDTFFLYVLEPVARGYKAVVPSPARSGIRNFFHNLQFPIRFVNTLLQGDLSSTADEVTIFIVNTTVGGLGFYPFSQNHLDLHTDDEDFGQTLGKWSLGEGIYLVLPLSGPASLRDAVGMAGDYWLDPVNYIDDWAVSLGVKGGETLNRYSFFTGEYEALTDAALDPYEALKAAYIQRRRALVADEDEIKQKDYNKRW